MEITKQHIIDTPLGWMQLKGNEQSISISYWIDDEDDLTIMKIGTPPIWAKEAEIQLKQYFKGNTKVFNLPLTPQITEFQAKVYQSLQQVSFGNTITYQQLALEHWDENHARAIGVAVGSNPLLLFIPCHRVIGSDGGLTGYAGGLKRKSELLALEGALGNRQLSLF